MGWGKEWPKLDAAKEDWAKLKLDLEPSVTAVNTIWQNAQAIAHEKLKLTGDVIITKTTIENGEVKVEVIPQGLVYFEEAAPISEKAYTNLAPTHDPYSNPGAFVYYECNCGAILDPKTKSFAGLNNAAMNAGWKIRWKRSGEGYQPFCPKCGEGMK